MGIKNFGVGGIDQKSNNLLRADIDLIDSRNIMANINGEYVKRPGTEEDINFSDVFQDAVFIKSLNQYFWRSLFGGYRSFNPDSLVTTIPYLWTNDPTNDITSKISLAEYLNTAIFTHEKLPNYTAKYDGRSVYAAGLPAPEVTVTSGSGTGFFLLTFFDFTDAQGNEIYGPATITPVANENPSITYLTPPMPFYKGKIFVDPTPAIAINASSRTITTLSVSADFDYTTGFCIGTKIPIKSTQIIGGAFNIEITDTASPGANFGDYTLMLEIESLTATTMTFTAASIGTKVIVISGVGTNSQNILGSYKFRAFISDNETTGYVGLPNKSCPIVDNSLSSNAFDFPNTIVIDAIGILLSDIYDITTSKLRPPKCKYLYTYGYQIVCGNVISFWDFNNKETTYTNNDLVMYSDLSTGDLGENFSEINRQLIGNTYDGQITGLDRVKDSLIVFKDRLLFALDGILLPGQYALRKIETNEIGCTSFKSILSVNSALMFQGQDGIYITDGYKCDKASEPLDPFFRTIDTSLTRSVMNNDLDQYLFWTDQGIAVFDYHHKKWYIWDSIDASKGITVDNDRSIRFFANGAVSKFHVELNDYGDPIDAYFRSNFFSGGEPGLLKKSTFLRIYSFNNVGQTVKLKYFLDWTETKTKGPFEINMAAGDKTIKRNLDIILNQSFSFEFRNDVLNEDLNISGYEVSAGITQERDKNVK